MNDIRSFASLSGSLLARKGGAKPAMRPRAIGAGSMLDDLGWDDMGYAPDQQPAEHVPSSIAGLTPAPKFPGARDEQPPVHLQQRALAERFVAAAPEPEEAAQAEPAAAPVPAPAPVVAEAPSPDPAPAPAEEPVAAVRQAAQVVPLPTKAAAPQGRKAAFTLRLDTARHLRLRLASAVIGQSAQQLVTCALDRFLETIPEVGNLAEQLPARSTKRS